MMSRSCCRWWMRFLRSQANRDIRGSALTQFKGIEAMIPNLIAVPFGNAGLCQSWLDVTLSTAAGSASRDGSWNERCPGCISFVAFESDTNADQTSTKRS